MASTGDPTIPATPELTVTLNLDLDTARRLEQLRARTGETRDALLRNAVRNGRDELEYHLSASETLERLRNGREETFSADEARRHLGLGH